MVMLKRKMWRDLMENKLAYFASLVVITIGLMIFSAISIVIDNLYAAKYAFYEEARFAEGFARVNGMPAAHLNRLARLEGIEEIEGRLVKDVRVLFPHLFHQVEKTVYLRLVSLPSEQGASINNPVLLEGSPLKAGDRGLWLSPAFLEAQGLAVGDELPLLVEGRLVPFIIRGTAQSPEFIYALRTGREIFPDPATFGVAYLLFDTMNTFFREHDRINDIAFLLQPGYSLAEVEENLKPCLEPYGLISLFSREDHPSHMILSTELRGLETSSTVMPLLFLSVAGIILYILLKRMVEQQRSQIGTMKAFGYTDRELLLHYLSHALFLGLIGGLAGGLLGTWLSFPFTNIYAFFFQLPGLTGRISYQYILVGMLLSLTVSALAGYFGCRAALKLQPAEAMRPAAPPPGRHTQLEKWSFYWRLLTIQGKMATRNLFRSRQRSLFTVIGVMFAFSMMAVTWYFRVITDIIIFEQLEKVQTHDVQINFSRALFLNETTRELIRFPGVEQVEPLLETPATLKHRWLEKDTIILGLPRDGFLYNIFTATGERVAPPEDGLFLSQRLADELKAQTGSELVLESYWLKNPLNVKVSGVIAQYVGHNAYMEIDALNRLLGLGSLTTAALLLMEEEAIPLLRQHYREAEPVAAIEERAALLTVLQELMVSFGYMQYIFAVFGLIIGFAIIYNSSIVSLSERKRELATLKVIGMAPGEVLQVITFEQWLLAIFGMLAGMPFAVALMYLMSRTMSNDLFSLPVRVEVATFIIALAGTTLAMLAAQWTIAWRIRNLSLVEVLKERD